MDFPVVLSAIVCAAVTMIFILIGFIWPSRGDVNCNLPLPPGSMGFPFIGETHQLTKFGYKKFLKDRLDKYGPVCKTYVYGTPAVIISGAAPLKKVLLGEYRLVNNCRNRVMSELLGKESLLLVGKAKHVPLRKSLLKLFTPNKIAFHLPMIERFARKCIAKWSDQKQFLVGEDLHSYVFDVVYGTTIGQDQKYAKSIAACFRKITRSFCCGYYPWFPWTRFAGALKERRYFMQIVENIILQAQREPSENPCSAMEVLINMTDDNGKKLEIDVIKDQLLLMLVAGYPEPGATLCAAMAGIAESPELLTKLREEQLKILPDYDSHFSMEHFKHMHLLKQVIWESLRQISPTLCIDRKGVKTFELNGYQVPAGWHILLALSSITDSCPHFSSPDKFDPERFSPERAEHLAGDPYWFKPFGAGKRSCIGESLAMLEMQAFLSLLVRFYNWELVNSPVPWNFERNVYVEDGFPVVFKQI